MRRLLVGIVLCFAVLCCQAQTVTNVVAKQLGKTIEISYDLDKKSEVFLLLSQDGGKTYSAIPKTIKGDIGVVSAGHRKMVWEMLSDSITEDIPQARFKVMARQIDKLTFNVGGTAFTMISVEGGTFKMGCTSEQAKDCEGAEKPVHQVTLDDYYIGETEVTQALWKAVMGTTIRQQRDKAEGRNIYGEGNDYAMYFVNWDECQKFVQKLNALLLAQLGGKRFALPTEAQWEYAARGGHKPGPYQYKYSGSDFIGVVAWSMDNSSSVAHPVARKSANTLDIYDMSGNVCEWCQDWYDSYTGSAQTNPQGADFGKMRVIRGGGWLSGEAYCRVSYRSALNPAERSSRVGFRLVLQ